MKRWLIGLCVFISGAWMHTALGQNMPAPLNQYFIAPQASANGVSNFVFNAPRKALYGFTAVTGASSGFVMVFDSAALPVNGAVTPDYCWPIGANSFLSVQWPSPVLMDTGVVVGFSTGANCDTLTASTTAKFMGQAL